MAILRLSEIRDAPKNEIQKKLMGLQKELMTERAKLASGGLPDNAGKISEIRKTISRIYTISKEKGYNLNV